MEEKRNQAELEIEYLEKEFLKYGEDSLPFPKEEIKIYEDDVQEIMKSGCNRQIAEYVMLKYKELEDKDSKNKKLCDLRKEYKKVIDPIIDKTVDELVDADKNNKLDGKNNTDNYEYEEEIDKILQSEKVKKIRDKENKDINNLYESAKNFFIKNYDKQAEQIDNVRKEYINKRDAVIESALRKVKKIVNDEEEYKKFYKEYYGEDEPNN